MRDRDELRQFLSAIRPTFAAAAAFSMVINVLLLVPAVYMLQVYDRVLASRNVDTLLMLTLLAALLYGLLAVSEWVRAQLLINAGLRLDASLSPRVFDAVVRASAGADGNMAVRAFGDATTLRQFLTGNGLFALFDAPWTPLFLFALFLIHPALGFVSLVGAVLLVLLTWFGEVVTHGPLSQALRLQAALAQASQGYVRNHDSMLAMGMVNAIRARWLGEHRRVGALQAIASRRAGALAASSRLIRMIQQMAILAAGAYYAIKGEVSPGAMIAGSILMGRALAPLDLALSSWRQFTGAREAHGRLRTLLAAQPPRPESIALPTPVGAVAAEELTVVPPGADIASLSDVSFEIRAGMAVGVVGPSGSGKSSLLRALTGVWPCTHGAVRLDGARIGELDGTRLGPHVGYLPQAVELFEGTVAENIARFGPLDPEAIVAAAHDAGVHQLILHLPQGYETRLGQDGLMLSGGQRQRIALARCLYGKPRLLVLDEPNSNLDEQGDEALLAALRKFKARGCTIVVVSHRRGVLDVTDGLLVLRDGKLVVYGPTRSVLQTLTPTAVRPTAVASA